MGDFSAQASSEFGVEYDHLRLVKDQLVMLKGNPGVWTRAYWSKVYASPTLRYNDTRTLKHDLRMELFNHHGEEPSRKPNSVKFVEELKAFEDLDIEARFERFEWNTFTTRVKSVVVIPKHVKRVVANILFAAVNGTDCPLDSILREGRYGLPIYSVRDLVNCIEESEKPWMPKLSSESHFEQLWIPLVDVKLSRAAQESSSSHVIPLIPEVNSSRKRNTVPKAYRTRTKLPGRGSNSLEAIDMLEHGKERFDVSDIMSLVRSTDERFTSPFDPDADFSPFSEGSNNRRFVSCETAKLLGYPVQADCTQCAGTGLEATFFLEAPLPCDHCYTEEE
jgi:hypothetical protein